MDLHLILRALDRLTDKVFSFYGVILILGLVAIGVFREQLGEWIRRLTSLSVSGSGISATSAQPQALPTNQATTSLGSSDYARKVAADVDPLVLDQRITSIYAEFDSQGVPEGGREEALMQLLAASLTKETWTRIYLYILGAQIGLLHKLNESPAAGLTDAELRQFYALGATRAPQLYRAVPYENWLEFLKATTLVSDYEDRYVITVLVPVQN